MICNSNPQINNLSEHVINGNFEILRCKQKKSILDNETYKINISPIKKNVSGEKKRFRLKTHIALNSLDNSIFKK